MKPKVGSFVYHPGGSEKIFVLKIGGSIPNVAGIDYSQNGWASYKGRYFEEYSTRIWCWGIERNCIYGFDPITKLKEIN